MGPVASKAEELASGALAVLAALTAPPEPTGETSDAASQPDGPSAAGADPSGRPAAEDDDVMIVEPSAAGTAGARRKSSDSRRRPREGDPAEPPSKRPATDPPAAPPPVPEPQTLAAPVTFSTASSGSFATIAWSSSALAVATPAQGFQWDAKAELPPNVIKPADKKPPLPQSQMYVIIRTIAKRDIRIPFVTPEMTVHQLKRRLEDRERITPKQQELYHNHKELKDDRRLKDYALKDGSVIHLIYKEN